MNLGNIEYTFCDFTKAGYVVNGKTSYIYHISLSFKLAPFGINIKINQI